MTPPISSTKRTKPFEVGLQVELNRLADKAADSVLCQLRAAEGIAALFPYGIGGVYLRCQIVARDWHPQISWKGDHARGLSAQVQRKQQHRICARGLNAVDTLI